MDWRHEFENFVMFFYTNLSAALPQKENGIFVYLFFDIMLCHKEKFEFQVPVHAK